MAGRLFATAAQLSLALFGFGMCVRDLINRRIRHGIFAGGHKLMDGHIAVVEPLAHHAAHPFGRPGPAAETTLGLSSHPLSLSLLPPRHQGGAVAFHLWEPKARW
jgi:hypothetical protein